ncbi:MAG: hypothetical protein QW512_03745 [Thermofilaceae archaeon]
MKAPQPPVMTQQDVRKVIEGMLSETKGNRCIIHSRKIKIWMKRKGLNPKLRFPVGSWTAMAPSSIKTERGTWILVGKRKRDNRYFLTYVLRKRKVEKGWTAL